MKKNIKVIMMSLMLLFSFALFGVETPSKGSESGGGGDLVRERIIREKEIILFTLSSKPDFLDKYGLDIEKLTDALSNVDEIKVVSHTLKDEKGSLVDAFVSNNVLEINKSTWQNYVEKNTEIKSLIFHEMLRVAGYDDDNYKISRHIDFNNHQRSCFSS